MKLGMQLIEQISKMEPIEFLGLAKLLGVQVLKENKEATGEKDKFKPRSFADVLEDVMAKFEKQSRGRKREIIKLVKKSNAARGGNSNASNAADS